MTKFTELNPSTISSSMAFCSPRAKLSIADPDTGEEIMNIKLPDGAVDLKPYQKLTRLGYALLISDAIVLGPDVSRMIVDRPDKFKTSANPNFKPRTMSDGEHRLQLMIEKLQQSDNRRIRREKRAAAAAKLAKTKTLEPEVQPIPEPDLIAVPPVEEGSLRDKASVKVDPASTPPE